MRIPCALALCLATPVHAWEFSATPICTLAHEGTEMSVSVTYDASLPEYAIHLTRDQGWPDAPVFALRFEGPNGLTISTNRHSVEGNTLTVRDSGFGNVLNGLQYNGTAVAILGDEAVRVSLDGAAPAVEAFRDCPADQLAWRGFWSARPRSLHRI